MSEDDFEVLTSAIDYPMFVVTCADGEGGGRAGCLVGFATQCSIEPPLYLVCISKPNHTEKVASRADYLGVHLLASDQRDVAELFGSHSGDEIDKFERCRWDAGPGGVPLLAECPNRFVGRIVDRHENGDHVGYVLAVVDATADREQAAHLELLTYQDVRDLHPGHEA